MLLTNAKNVTKGIDSVIAELDRLSRAIEKGNRKQIEALLEKARVKRAALIEHKLKNKEILS